MWPTALQLSPSQHNPVPVQLLIQWASLQQCLPLQVLQHPQAPDPKANDEHFRALHRLLTEKNVVRVSSSLLSSRKLPATHCLVPPVGQYALSAWPPSEPKNRLLIFPHNGLAAVFFYGPGGMPELPKPQDRSPVPCMYPVASASVSYPTTQDELLAHILSQMTPEQQAKYLQIPAEERNMRLTTWLAKLNQSRQQWQQIKAQLLNANRQQSQRRHAPPQPLLQPQNPNATFFGIGIPGSQQPGMGGPQGMHLRAPSENVPGGGPDVDDLCSEMMQLFVQRSQDGGGPNGSLGDMA